MLTIVGGPMFSGKTTWIIDYVERLPQGSFIVYKPDIDTRFGKDVCVTHHGRSYPAINLSTKKTMFTQLNNKITTIVIDELNFFSSSQLIAAIQEQRSQGRDVVGAGLLYDYKKQPFGATLPLSKIADSFIQLFARCDKCGNDAVHSYRKVAEKNQFFLGAKESYGACCEDCWGTLSGRV